MEKALKVGIIGYGSRGEGLTSTFELMVKEGKIEVTAVCDEYEDRAKKACEVFAKDGTEPLCTTDYRELIACKNVEAVLVISAWESHVEIMKASMRAGKPVGTEVGCAYSIYDCFELVRVYEETGVECMMLENCCYGRREMMALNMVRQGVFGDVVHCSGGYMHDLRYEISYGDDNRHYRQRNYLHRNCENYPTHELGPIMQVLNINNGNRLLTLSSTASDSWGLHEYFAQKRPEHPLANAHFAQGDFVTTVIKCAQGQTITLTLDTTLPRIYSRGFTVRGTKGMYCADGDYIHMDGENEFDLLSAKIGNAAKYEEQYEHPMWKEYNKNPIGGHDGIDWLVYNAFVDSIRNNTKPPIDVYDTATLMCISTLTEQSVALGGAPVAIPDFTHGAWMNPKTGRGV